ncbi:TolC family protein [Legionella worsleiensis]|uniref:HelC protein n=1 Tax=Legionella worsleiensis TaxID=45076 RepID=A0A0W1ALR5_9GAMM|nr:TolC family protein [Legionella worsleiensis]KTD82099.1 HelC protein [Legionella worsleiensis]STY31468.1 Heavy metal RND efflux outer membrane protein, CzcC family [Legionella worsleiensis]
MRIFFYITLSVLSLVSQSIGANTALTFQRALALAYQNNPELQAELDKANAMKGMFMQSKLYPNPQLAFTAENIGGSGQYSGYESAETTIALTQPIPLGHRLQYLQKMTYADYQTSLARIKLNKFQLFNAVGTAYIDALYADQWHRVTKKLVKVNVDIVSAIQRRVDAGAGGVLDLRLAQVRLGEARIQKMKAERDALMLRARLARFLGGKLRVDNQLTDEGLKHTRWTWPKLLKKIANSPLLIEKHRVVQAKRAAIVSAKKDVWPDLNIQLGGRHFSDDGSNAAVVSAYSQVPVYNRNQGTIYAAQAQYTQALHELKGAQLEVRQNLYAAYLQAEQGLFETNLVTESLLPLARQSLQVARDGYQMGRYTYIELSTALSTLFDEERHYQQAHAEYHKALLTVAGLLGINVY